MKPYVGGKPRNKGTHKGPQKGWLEDLKVPVVSLVEGGVKVRSFIAERINAKSISKLS
jgi:hypothetical protein